MKSFNCFCLILFLLLQSLGVVAQRTMEHQYVTIQMIPNHADWNYKIGEKVTFTIAVMKDNFPQPNVQIEYSWGPEMKNDIPVQTINTGKGYTEITLEGMTCPGFMTLNAKTQIAGNKYTNYITVAFEPDKIRPFVHMPEDFDIFWEQTIRNVRSLPLDPILTPMPEYSTSQITAYHVRFCNGSTDRYIYGVLSVPNGKGPYPAVLQVPGAGVRRYIPNNLYPQAGVIFLRIGIHGIPVNLPDEIYNNLRFGALDGYTSFNSDDREKYYYKNVYAGCVRAMDFLCSLPQTDISRLAVCGGSQGGGLAIVTAALDSRIRCLWANHPAMCDIAGYYYGGIGGWPHRFRNPNEPNIEQKIKVLAYYDVVNFARKLKVPFLLCMGYNDKTCPPTSQMAAYNVINSPKSICLIRDAAHWIYPETEKFQREWLIHELKK